VKSIILHFTDADKPYLGVVKPIVSGRVKCYLDNSKPDMLMEFSMKSRSKENATIVSTDVRLLEKVFPYAKNPKISEYSGNLVTRGNTNYLFIDPLANLVTTTTGKFLFQRYLKKVWAPEQFILEPEFKWELFEPSRLEYLVDFFERCVLIATDIETIRNDPERRISCVGISGMQMQHGKLQMVTVVVPATDEYSILFIKLVLSSPVPKVLQNGKYDIAYFLRYNICVTNYAMDTLNLFHCWYSELPKDLGFISSFMLRSYVFHKNDGKTGDLMDYYQYNAMDCYTTLLCCLGLLLELPDYAWVNYQQEFPMVFPCILSEHTGIKYDQERADKLAAEVEVEKERVKKELQVMVACPTYNPSSPPQTVRLWAVLGSKDVTDTKPPSKDKVANRHPLNKVIVDKITSVREDVKLSGSYYKDGIAWNGRCFYALNPHGTSTGRLASRESQFWCGLQIQNIPHDEEDEDVGSVKESFVADSGYYFGEADYAQAESRGTGYLSGDTALIEAVDNPERDFHGTNASKFFGVPYEQIVQSVAILNDQGELLEWTHKTLDKILRNVIGKRINHGANYNMGPQVMLDTMGIKNVILAKQKLKLPDRWVPLQVTTYLLSLFDKTYHIMKGPYYDSIKTQVKMSSKLVGPTEWTRYCFGNPSSSKRDLNSYVAHPSQSLNAMLLNRAYLKVFRNVWMKHPQDFRLCAQIHDSILFQYKKDREDLAWEVKKQMRCPIMVTDTFKKVRELIVPVDLKGGAERWSDVKVLKQLR